MKLQASQNFLKALFLLALLSAVGALIVFTLREATLPLLCKDVYLIGHQFSCVNGFESSFTISFWALTIFSTILLLLISFFNKASRKFFLRFLIGFVPFLILALLIGFFVPFCLGAWLGCSSSMPLMLMLVAFVFAVGLFASAFALFVHPKMRIISVIFLIIILSFGSNIFLSSVDELKDQLYDRDFPNIIHNTGDITLCDTTPIPAQRDKCVWNFALRAGNEETCEQIEAYDLRKECVAFVIRNRAIENLDTSLCDEIDIVMQQHVCKNRIRDRLN